MAGCWPSSFFAFWWTETKSRSINAQKRTRPISSHLDRTSLVNKGFIIWLLLRLRGNFSCGTQRVIPSGQDSSILPARVANHCAGSVWFILPAHGTSQIIKSFIQRSLFIWAGSDHISSKLTIEIGRTPLLFTQDSWLSDWHLTSGSTNDVTYVHLLVPEISLNYLGKET